MSKPLKNPPVYFTLVQVRFNAILKLSDYLPAIQEGLRRSGYPAYSAQKFVTLQLNVNAQDGQAVPQPAQLEQYSFANVGQTHSFVLGADALTFQSTNYGTYEAFSEAFLKGLALVHETVRLDFTERIGLRYLDQVFPEAGDPLEKYLAPEIHGLGARLGGKAVHSFAETLNEIGDIHLRLRLLVQDGSLTFPPDLQPSGMSVDPRFSGVSGMHATIDTDGFVQGRELFSLDEISRNLREIHGAVSTAFRTAVTPHALEVWNQE